MRLYGASGKGLISCRRSLAEGLLAIGIFQDNRRSAASATAVPSSAAAMPMASLRKPSDTHLGPESAVEPANDLSSVGRGQEMRQLHRNTPLPIARVEKPPQIAISDPPNHTTRFVN